MSEDIQPLCVRRILVPLDHSKHSLAALHAAVVLARHYEAELRGVFVEDTTLLKLAELPFHQEVGEYTASIREISSEGLTRGIFVQSQWIIKSFRRLVHQTDLNGDFIVLRGDVSEIINGECHECDLVVIGKSGKNILGASRLGSTARKMIQCHQIPLLLVEENNQLGAPIILLFDNSPAAKVGLETAREFLDPNETLIILVNKDDPQAYAEAKAYLTQWTTIHPITISIETFRTRSIHRFIQMIDRLKIGLFILPQHSEPINKEIIAVSLEKISLPILLIRDTNQLET